MSGPSSDRPYEDCLAELKRIAAELDRPDIPLAEFREMYERAQGLAAICRKRLNEIRAAIDGAAHP